MKTDYLERQSYPTDLTDEQWATIAPLFVGMREYKHSKRELTNAVLYLVDSGCKWRQLPHDFPPVFTVHSFYRRARLSGLWDKILEHLVKLTWQKAGLSEEPTQALIDSQSVKTTGAVDQKGFDGGKNERSKTPNRHRRHWLSFSRCYSQSEFARHENRLLGSRLGNFCLSDVEENLRRWRLSRVFCLRGIQIFRLASRDK